MKNKMTAVFLVVALASLGISPAWAQQQPGAKDANTKCACCEHTANADTTEKKDATQHSGSAACQEMKKQGTACCGTGEAKTGSNKDAKADCCKGGKMDCCKEAANCCAGKDAKMCQSKEGCCGESRQCPSAKGAAK